MAQTKKLLVAFDPKMPEAQSSDFLIPWDLGNQPVFRGLKSGKGYTFGMMVFVGVAISENDLFAKLVDSGAVINSVDKTLTCLRIYIEQLQTLRIGNIVGVISNAEGQAFGLRLISKTPSGAQG